MKILYSMFNKKESLKGIEEERARLHRKMAAMSLEIYQYIKDKNKYIGFYKQIEDIHSVAGKIR